jgi:hypothetical protein
VTSGSPFTCNLIPQRRLRRVIDDFRELVRASGERERGQERQQQLVLD